MHYRGVVVIAVFLSILSACDGSSSDESSADGLNVVSWGGAYEFSQVEAYHKPWAAKTGHAINSISFSGGLEQIRDQLSSGQVVWDVVDLELHDVETGCRDGLLEKIDSDLLPAAPDGALAAQDFIEGTLHDCGVGSIVWSTIIAYDTSVLTTPPSSVADFFDTTVIPGKRGLRRHPKAALEMALIADGVLAENVYSVLGTQQGEDRAFAQLDRIKADIVWWDTGSQSIQILVDQDVVMTTTHNSRAAHVMIEQTHPIDILWDVQVWDADYWVVPKGSPNKVLALDFIHFSTATEQLAAQASFIAFGPARRSSYTLVGNHHETHIDMKPLMPTAPQNMLNALQHDEVFWAQNGADLVTRFEAWIAE